MPPKISYEEADEILKRVMELVDPGLNDLKPEAYELLTEFRQRYFIHTQPPESLQKELGA